MEKENIHYSTHQLREDKDLIVVLRGVIETLPEDDIRAELNRRKLPIKSIYRMRKGDKIWPLVSVNLDAKSPSARSIYDLKTLCGINIKVEPKRKSKIVPQCRRCLQFRHTANFCTKPWVCAFCAKSHATTSCTLKDTKSKSPTCKNCGGSHRATYGGCPKFPVKKPSPTGPAQSTAKPASSPSKTAESAQRPQTRTTPKPSTSYSQAVNGRPTTPVQHPLSSPTLASPDPFQNPVVFQLFRDFASQLALAFQQPNNRSQQ